MDVTEPVLKFWAPDFWLRVLSSTCAALLSVGLLGTTRSLETEGIHLIFISTGWETFISIGWEIA